MPRIPASISWDIGRDKHNRRVTLHWKYGEFSLVIDPANQRDDGCHSLDGLTRDCILAAAEILKDFEP